MNSKLKWDDQVNHAAFKATSVLGMLNRTFVHWIADLFLRLYPTYVRPHLEYYSSVWKPPNWFQIFGTSITSPDWLAQGLLA